jgi:general secretion pathway protein L
LSDALLIFLDAHNEFEGWLQVADGAVTARGRGLEGLPALVDTATGKPVRVAAIVPGEAVAMHWLEVPAGLAPAQAAAAARLMAEEVSTQPLGDMHVAVARRLRARPCERRRWCGDHDGGLARQAPGAGARPGCGAARALAARPPREGFVRHERGGLPLYRGPTEAFSVEPELADLIVDPKLVEPLDEEAFEGGLGDSVTYRPSISVRVRSPSGGGGRSNGAGAQADDAGACPGRRDARHPGGGDLQIYARGGRAGAGDEPDRRDRLAESGPVTDPSRQLESRLSEMRGSGPGYSAMASAIFGAVRDTPNVELTALFFDQSGSMRATVQADSPSTIALFQQRIEASGFSVSAGEMRSGGGRPTADVTVRQR